MLPFTWLLFRVRWLVPGGMPPLPFPLEMPPPFKRGVAVHMAVGDGDRAQQVLDAATPGVGGGVAVHLAAIEGQELLGLEGGVSM